MIFLAAGSASLDASEISHQKTAASGSEPML